MKENEKKRNVSKLQICMSHSWFKKEGKGADEVSIVSSAGAFFPKRV